MTYQQSPWDGICLWQVSLLAESITRVGLELALQMISPDIHRDISIES